MPLVKALLINKDAKGFAPIVVMFNPPSLKITRATRYADIKTINTDPGKKQFIKPENDTLTVELFFDTTVIGSYLSAGVNYAGLNKIPHVDLNGANMSPPVGFLLKPIFDLARPAKGKDEPPRVIFAWGDLIFPGFIVSIEQKSDYFHTLGWAQRATLTITILHCEFDPGGVK